MIRNSRYKKRDFKHYIKPLTDYAKANHGCVVDIGIQQNELHHKLRSIARAFAIMSGKPNCVIYLFGFSPSDDDLEPLNVLQKHYDIQFHLVKRCLP